MSFVPAVTELCFVLEAWDRVVGVSHECDFPPQAEKLPRVTRPRLDPRLPAAELDAAVKTLARKGESLFAIEWDALERLKPDLLIAQTDCEVCAITSKDLGAIQDRLRPRPDTLPFQARSYEEYQAQLRGLGKLLNRTEAAKRQILKEWSLAKEIRRMVEPLQKPRVAVLDWIDPVMFAGHWTQELVEMGGGEYGLVPVGQPSRAGSWEELEEYEPDVILAAPCGRNLDKAADELAAAIRKHDVWDLAPVEQGRLFAADGNKFFSRPGPRLVYSAALVARAAHWDRVPPLPAGIEEALGRLEVPRKPPADAAKV